MKIEENNNYCCTWEISYLQQPCKKEVINGCNKWHKYTLVLFVPKLPTFPFCTSKKNQMTISYFVHVQYSKSGLHYLSIRPKLI